MTEDIQSKILLPIMGIVSAPHGQDRTSLIEVLIGSTVLEVHNLVTENVAVDCKLKLLKELVLTFKKELEEVKQRLDDVEGSHDDLEQYIRKFNLIIHEIPKR
ncbi:hypothetical protein pdam_00000488 [Pocillopora damicornis]|uniref:Uncharacterized protein n=1 Tax=Pocillopora damicornis TaxID=46731 RepID=A0A3M6UJQ4_POCDA|nr:hypothetical protein pdam_00000488 [Pocillopora damicornis]